LNLGKRLDVGDNVVCDTFSAWGDGERSLVFIVGGDIEWVDEVCHFNFSSNFWLVFLISDLLNTERLDEIVVVEGLSSIEEDGDNGSRLVDFATFCVECDLKLSIHWLSVNWVLGGRLNLHLVRSVVDRLLRSIGGPDKSFINSHIHLMSVNVQNGVAHVSETRSSKLEITISVGSISSDNVDGRLSHSWLAETGPLILLGEVRDGPVSLGSSCNISVTITDSSNAGDEHGRDKWNFGNHTFILN
jgi:hypothetical protein